MSSRSNLSQRKKSFQYTRVQQISKQLNTTKMTTTTYPDFNAKTEALDVASAFAGQIKGRTILITGVNVKGIGFATAEAFVSSSH